MNTIKVKQSGFFILEIGYDKFKAYRPYWAGWTDTFETRRAARKAMSAYVNGLNDSVRGGFEYVRSTDNSGRHDGISFVVCNAKEAQSIIDERFHLSLKASLPWWVSTEESED